MYRAVLTILAAGFLLLGTARADDKPKLVKPTPKVPTLVRAVAKEQTHSLQLEVLIATVRFDAKGQLQPLEEDGSQGETLLAGTFAAKLATWLNEEAGALPEGMSPATAGAGLMLDRLSEDGRIEALERIQLSLTANGESVTTTTARRVPRVTATSFSSRGMANQVNMENLGTIVDVSARVISQGKILMAFTLERSVLAPEDEGVPITSDEKQTVKARGTGTMSVKTTVTVADGRSLVISNLVNSSAGEVTESFVLITAKIAN